MKININKLVSALTVLGVIPDSNTKRFRYHLTPTPPRQFARDLYIDFNKSVDLDNHDFWSTHYEFLNELIVSGVEAATLFEVRTPNLDPREFTLMVLLDVERFSIENFLSQVDGYIRPFLINEYLTPEYNNIIVRAEEEFWSPDLPEYIQPIENYRYAADVCSTVGCKLVEVTLYQTNLILKIIPDLE